MLAIITKMTLTQVSTWFANARRRLKKENKMTWEPKNRTDVDDDANASDENKDREEHETSSRRTNVAVKATTGIAEGNVGRVDVPSGLEEVGEVGVHPKGHLSDPSGNLSIGYSLNTQQHYNTAIQKQPKQLKQLKYGMNEQLIMREDFNASCVKAIPNIRRFYQDPKSGLSRVESSEENLSPDKQRISKQHHQRVSNLRPYEKNQTSFVATLSIQANKSNDAHAFRDISVPNSLDVTVLPFQSSLEPLFETRKPRLFYKDSCCT